MRPTIAKLFVAAIVFGGVTMLNPGSAHAQSDADRTYKTNCVMCHGGDGGGGTPSGRALQAKDLRSPEVQKRSDEDLATVITTGKGKMPAFGKKLSATDIQKLVAYIRTLPKAK